MSEAMKPEDPRPERLSLEGHAHWADLAAEAAEFYGPKAADSESRREARVQAEEFRDLAAKLRQAQRDAEELKARRAAMERLEYEGRAWTRERGEVPACIDCERIAPGVVVDEPAERFEHCPTCIYSHYPTETSNE